MVNPVPSDQFEKTYVCLNTILTGDWMLFFRLGPSPWSWERRKTRYPERFFQRNWCGWYAWGRRLRQSWHDFTIHRRSSRSTVWPQKWIGNVVICALSGASPTCISLWKLLWLVEGGVARASKNNWRVSKCQCPRVCLLSIIQASTM